MLSKRTSGWKLHDWFFAVVFLFVVSAIVLAALHGFAPNSGATRGIHDAGQHIAQFFTWVADFFHIVASWFAGW